MTTSDDQKPKGTTEADISAGVSCAAPSGSVTMVKNWQVVQKADGRKYVAGRDHPLPEGAAIICDSPHEDSDFSYCCGRDCCRCMQ